MYDTGRAAFGNAGINWLSDTIQTILVDTSLYTVNLATDDFLADIPVGARVGAPLTLTGKTNVAGVLDASDLAYTGLVGAPSIEALVIFKSTGDDATSQLIAYIDTATGLPVPAGASQVNVAWDNGANKIMKI
jgi:hypothetical protein